MIKIHQIWQDIKETFREAFSFLKEREHQRNLGIVSFISCLYILPIILADIPFADDIERFHYVVGWTHDARFLINYIVHWISLGKDFLPFDPYGQIVASLLFAWSGYLLTVILGVRSNFARVTTSVVLLIFPFTLHNLIYQYESDFMALSIFVLMAPFLFVRKLPYFFFLSILGLLINLFTYQASFPVYSIVVCLLILILATEDKNKEILKFISFSVLAIFVTLLFYKILIAGAYLIYGDGMAKYEARGKVLIGLPLVKNILIQIPQIILKELGNFTTAQYYYSPILILGFLSALSIYFKEMLSSLKKLNKIWFSLAFLAIPFLSISLLATLAEGLMVWRVFLPISFAIMGYLVFSARYYPKLSSILSFFLILFSFFLVKIFITAQQDQYQWEERIVIQMLGDLEIEENSRFVVSGSISAPFVDRIEKTAPFISTRRLIFSNLTERRWQTFIALIKNLKLVPHSTWAVSENDRQEILANRLNYPIIKRGTFYVIRKKENIFILDFKKDNP